LLFFETEFRIASKLHLVAYLLVSFFGLNTESPIIHHIADTLPTPYFYRARYVNKRLHYGNFGAPIECTVSVYWDVPHKNMQSCPAASQLQFGAEDQQYKEHPQGRYTRRPSSETNISPYISCQFAK